MISTVKNNVYKLRGMGWVRLTCIKMVSLLALYPPVLPLSGACWCRHGGTVSGGERGTAKASSRQQAEAAVGGPGNYQPSR